MSKEKKVKKGISEEVAMEEIQTWLDFMNFNEDEIEEKEPAIKIIKREMMEGKVILNENKEFEFTLYDPLVLRSGSVELDVIKFSNRRFAGQRDAALDKGDGQGSKVTAMARLYSGESETKINRLDRKDHKIVQAFGLLFL